MRRPRFRLKQAIGGLALLLVPTGSGAWGQEAARYAVVVHASNPSTALKRTQVSEIFLKKVRVWKETRAPILPVDQSERSMVRASFSKDVHGRSVAAIRNYWQQMIFSGRGVPPPEAASDKQVVDFVRANPGAIGYVSSEAVPRDLKVLEVLE